MAFVMINLPSVCIAVKNSVRGLFFHIVETFGYIPFSTIPLTLIPLEINSQYDFLFAEARTVKIACAIKKSDTKYRKNNPNVPLTLNY